jgi:putative membrane protein
MRGLTPSRTSARWWLMGALLALAIAGPSCSDSNNNPSDAARAGTGGTGGTGGAGGTGGGVGSDAAVDGSADGRLDGAPLDGSGDARLDVAVGDGAGDAAARLTDTEVAGVMLEANTGEVGAGQVAATRAAAMPVQDFAQRMINEHSAANRSLSMLLDQQSITPADSPVRRMLGATAHDAVDMLWATPAGSFDRVYMQSQVDMHTMVLTLVDTVLLPSVTNAALRGAVMEMRATVVMHLADARALLASGFGDGGVDGGGGNDAGADATGDGP